MGTILILSIGVTMFLRIVFVSLLLVGCSSHYVSVQNVNVDPSILPSTFAKSPTPIDTNKYYGERIYVSWHLPFFMQKEGSEIVLKVVYKDLTEEEFSHRVTHRMGFFTKELLGEEFDTKKGYLSYQASLLNSKGETVDTWTHQMWVNIIH